MSRASAYLKRKTSGRTANDYGICVIYDGELTEDAYFRSWQQILSQGKLSLYPNYVTSGGNPYVAVKESIKLKKKVDNCAEFWCVTDVDDASADDVEKAKSAALKNGIKLCLSNRCFEVWLGLHFNRSDRTINSEDDAIASIRECGFTDYGNPRKILEFSVLFPNTLTAISNANWLLKRNTENPQTNVHSLVKKLHENLNQRAAQ